MIFFKLFILLFAILCLIALGVPFVFFIIGIISLAKPNRRNQTFVTYHQHSYNNGTLDEDNDFYSYPRSSWGDEYEGHNYSSGDEDQNPHDNESEQNFYSYPRSPWDDEYEGYNYSSSDEDQSPYDNEPEQSWYEKNDYCDEYEEEYM